LKRNWGCRSVAQIKVKPTLRNKPNHQRKFGVGELRSTTGRDRQTLFEKGMQSTKRPTVDSNSKTYNHRANNTPFNAHRREMNEWNVFLFQTKGYETMVRLNCR